MTQQTGFTPSSVPLSLFPYKVWIDPDALLKLNMYAAAALPTEIGGLAKIRQDDENGWILIEDVHMFKQEASGAYFTFSADEMNKFTIKLLKEGREDEIPLWRSIVHSHPVGMSPSMSSVDITMLENFSHEQDAFSLIITASREADSKRMFMHYCTNVNMCGVNKKIIVKDIPVLTAMSGQQAEMRDKLMSQAVEVYGKESLDEKQYNEVLQAIQEFVISKLPMTTTINRQDMREVIDAHVKELITNTSAAPKAGGAPVKKKTGTAPSSTAGPTTLPSITMGGTACTDLERMMGVIDRLFQIWSWGCDPEKPDRAVSKNMGKQARKLWVRAIKQYNNIIRPIEGVGLMDTVAINHEATNHEKFKDKVYEVLSYMPSDMGAGGFEVADEVFMGHELDVDEDFERWWNRVGEKAMPVFWGLKEMGQDVSKEVVVHDSKVIEIPDENIMDDLNSHWRIETEDGLVRYLPKSKYDKTGRALVPIK